MSKMDAVKMNLSALRKVDSSISSIIDTANQVALYKYVSEDSKWEKTDIEGTLFVYMRSPKPQHGFIVMNRLSTTNLVEPITEKLDFQDQSPFLLYRNDKGCIYGIWFYENTQCVKIFKLISSLSQLIFTKSDKATNGRQRSYSESNRKQKKQENNQADIISLLSKAQDEYDKKSSTKGSSSRSSRKSQQTLNGDIVKPTPVRPDGSSASSSAAPTPLTLGMLFAKAGGLEQKTDFEKRLRSFTAGPELKTGLPSAEAILQNLLSNSAHTLQHIEGLQQQGEGKVAQGKTRKVKGVPPLSAESVEKDLREKLNLLPKTRQSKEEEGGKESHFPKGEPPSEPIRSKPIDIPILTPAMLESSFLSAPATTIAIGSFAEKAEDLFETCNNTPGAKNTGSFSPSQLLSPMDFTMPIRKKVTQLSRLSSSHSPDVLTNGFGNCSGELLHPQSLLNGPSASAEKSKVTPLNKDQFREALVYMLQNDDNFVMQLHECYVKSLRSQLNLLGSS